MKEKVSSKQRKYSLKLVAFAKHILCRMLLTSPKQFSPRPVHWWEIRNPPWSHPKLSDPTCVINRMAVTRCDDELYFLRKSWSTVPYPSYFFECDKSVPLKSYMYRELVTRPGFTPPFLGSIFVLLASILTSAYKLLYWSKTLSHKYF